MLSLDIKLYMKTQKKVSLHFKVDIALSKICDVGN